MPYNEFEEQASEYFENAKRKLESGNRGGARSDFNMARAIASKNNMYGLIELIDTYLKDL